MKSSAGWVLALLLAGCGDSSSSSGGSKCTGALYDKCAGASGCTSATCQTSPSIGMYCTQPCSPSEPCPTQGGNPVTCSNQGVCLPASANSCTL